MLDSFEFIGVLSRLLLVEDEWDHFKYLCQGLVQMDRIIGKLYNQKQGPMPKIFSLQENQMKYFTDKTLSDIFSFKKRVSDLSLEEMEDYYQGLCIFYEGTFPQYKAYILEQIKSRKKGLQSSDEYIHFTKKISKETTCIFGEMKPEKNISTLEYEVTQDTNRFQKYEGDDKTEKEDESVRLKQKADEKKIKQKEESREKYESKSKEKIKQVEEKIVQPKKKGRAKKKYTWKILNINEFGQTKQMTFQEILSAMKNDQEKLSMLLNPSTILQDKIVQHKLEESSKLHWQKKAGKILSICWKEKGAEWFHEPVVPQKLGIEDYFQVIKKPMDFSTIKKKLEYNFYPHCKAFKADILLVFQNCYKYNGPKHLVSLKAKQIQSTFLKYYGVLLQKYQQNTE